MCLKGPGEKENVKIKKKISFKQKANTLISGNYSSAATRKIQFLTRKIRTQSKYYTHESVYLACAAGFTFTSSSALKPEFSSSMTLT